MLVEIKSLSSSRSPSLSSNLNGMTYKQFRRTYGNCSINFSHSLSSYKDFKVKNYTNFYLTNNFKASDILYTNIERLKSDKIYSSISYGNTHLTFNANNDLYGTVSFSNTLSSNTSKFNLIFKDNNVCNIYYTNNYYKDYYLCNDINNDLYFVNSKNLLFDTSYINPQDFKYLFSEDLKKILLFKLTEDGTFLLTKIGNSLSAIPVGDDDVLSNLVNPFEITNNLYKDHNYPTNFSFITYTDDNKIDLTKSKLDLTNNFLLHNEYSSNRCTDLLVLKNQTLPNDVFSSASNTLSSENRSIYVNDLKSYNSIIEDIKEERSNDIELNYIFYNKEYKIKSGKTEFTSPSSMYPFSKININDTKFVDSGAFSFTTPEYADKVYALSEDSQLLENGQSLLCTWLSGSPFSDNKVWIDRYYYPDLISKQEALQINPLITATYSDSIETLIRNNISTQDSVIKNKYYDKKSDFLFEPNKKYIYERISKLDIDSPVESTINPCNSLVSGSNQSSNYFKSINKTGKFTFGATIDGDTSNWVLKSDRNDIDCGLTITKTNDTIRFDYNLFDPDSQGGKWQYFTASSPIKRYKKNFICVSMDSVKGIGYFALNNEVLLTFEFPIYEILVKQLLYGDFYLYYNNERISVLDNITYPISYPYITSEFLESDLFFIIPIIQGVSIIDDIYITLPCGMVNGIDNINILNTACGSNAFKSNNINIIIKNTNITNETIQSGLKDSILSTIENYLPVNYKVNNIKFENYK